MRIKINNLLNINEFVDHSSDATLLKGVYIEGKYMIATDGSSLGVMYDENQFATNETIRLCLDVEKLVAQNPILKKQRDKYISNAEDKLYICREDGHLVETIKGTLADYQINNWVQFNWRNLIPLRQHITDISFIHIDSDRLKKYKLGDSKATLQIHGTIFEKNYIILNTNEHNFIGVLARADVKPATNPTTLDKVFYYNQKEGN